MATFIFTCPFCGQRMECDDTMAEMSVNCPKCGEEIVPARDEYETPTGNNVAHTGATQKNQDSEVQKKPEHAAKNIMHTVSELFRTTATSQNAAAGETTVCNVDTKRTFKTPLLALLFRSIGFVYIAASVFVLILPLLIETRLSSLEVFVFAALGCAVSAIISFGVAQIIYSICKTAYNSDRIVELLTELKDKK